MASLTLAELEIKFEAVSQQYHAAFLKAASGDPNESDPEKKLQTAGWLEIAGQLASVMKILQDRVSAVQAAPAPLAPLTDAERVAKMRIKIEDVSCKDMLFPEDEDWLQSLLKWTWLARRMHAYWRASRWRVTAFAWAQTTGLLSAFGFGASGAMAWASATATGLAVAGAGVLVYQHYQREHFKDDYKALMAWAGRVRSTKLELDKLVGELPLGNLRWEMKQAQAKIQKLLESVEAEVESAGKFYGRWV